MTEVDFFVFFILHLRCCVQSS